MEAGRTNVCYLDPVATEFEEAENKTLSVRLGDGTVHERVKVYHAFPLSDPDEYIVLRRGTTALEQEEIGVVRDLQELRPKARELVRRELTKRYFIHIISRIRRIRREFGHLYWDVDTDKGQREFAISTSDQNNVQAFGDKTRIIVDVDMNRYEIPDIEQLDTSSRNVFDRYIFW